MVWLHQSHTASLSVLRMHFDTLLSVDGVFLSSLVPQSPSAPNEHIETYNNLQTVG